MAAEPLPPPLALRQMLTGAWTAQCLYVAAKLELADRVKDGPRGSAELAAATGVNADALHRVLRALASVGVFAEDDRGRFGLTPLAACLRKDVPGSQWAMAVMMGEEHFRAWAEVLASVRTGEPAFDRVYGRPIFDYLADHSEAARTFDAAMTGVHGAETAAMLDAYDFAGLGTLVDVGGGNGTLLVGTLQRNPGLRGVLFDRPHVVERARDNLRAAGLDGRCTVVGGDFFESVPGGGDAYLMRHIIHDWDDERSRVILRNCRRVVRPGGRLLLVETVIPPGNGASFAKFLDVNMLVIPGGRERTEAQYRDLLGAAGFRLTRVVPTRMEVDVIEAVPA
jgi:SAM-dependent methyltransferase